jgi:outer membrane lipoprotein-sorting protein
MLHKLFSLTFTIFILITSAYSQTVDEIIAQMQKANGYDNLKNVQSWKIIGDQTAMGMSMPFTQYIKNPNLFRYEQEIMGSKIIMAYDGNEGWMLNPMSGTETQPISPEQLDKLKNQKYMLQGPLSDYKARGIKIELVGKDNVDGKDTYKFNLNDKDAMSQLWVDASTYLPLKFHTSTAQMGKSIETDIFFKEYKNFSGVMMPAVVDMNAGGFNATTVFSSIDFNTPMDDSLFKKPAK